MSNFNQSFLLPSQIPGVITGREPLIPVLETVVKGVPGAGRQEYGMGVGQGTRQYTKGPYPQCTPPLYTSCRWVLNR